MSSFPVSLDTYNTQSRYGAEPSDTNGKQNPGLPYDWTFRFLPPSNRKPLLHALQSGVIEIIFTFFFVFIVSSSIAGGADTLTRSLIVGSTYAGLEYLLWNWGRPQGNPAVTIALALTGHINAMTTAANLIGQCGGALAGAGVQWGFFDADGGVTPPVVAGTKTLGVIWGWEIFCSFILTSGILWAMSDRLFAEFQDVDRQRLMKKQDSPSLMSRTMPPEINKTTQDVPVGLQKKIYSFMAGRTAIAGGILYWALTLIGYLFHGAPVYNFWFWISHALAPAAAPVPGAMSTGIQFALYAFGPLVGAIGATLIMCAFIVWYRAMASRNEGKCDGEEKDLWFWPRY